MNNPYAAPAATVSDQFADGETYQPKMTSSSGRIGRLRYIGYTMALYLLVSLAGGILLAVIVAMFGASPLLADIFAGLISLGALAFGLIQAKRRFQDLNRSGKLMWLMLLPIVNFVVGLYLIFAPGSEGINDYGPAPAKNSRWMWLLALIPVFIFVLGILAAIAIPAYQDYLHKAKAAREMQR